MSSSIENSSVKFYTTATIPNTTDHVIEPGAVYLYEHDSVMDMYVADGTKNPVLLTTGISRYVPEGDTINLDELVATQTIAIAAEATITGGDPWGTTQESSEVAFILDVIAGNGCVLQRAYTYTDNPDDNRHLSAQRTAIYDTTLQSWNFSPWVYAVLLGNAQEWGGQISASDIQMLNLADRKHDSSLSTYGLGTESKYGHVKLSNEELGYYPADTSVWDGIAAGKMHTHYALQYNSEGGINNRYNLISWSGSGNNNIEIGNNTDKNNVEMYGDLSIKNKTTLQYDDTLQALKFVFN